ncbi:MAG: hypothetical protein ABJZ55_16140 [Fuerstiella sp.]
MSILDIATVESETLATRILTKPQREALKTVEVTESFIADVDGTPRVITGVKTIKIGEYREYTDDAFEASVPGATSGVDKAELNKGGDSRSRTFIEKNVDTFEPKARRQSGGSLESLLQQNGARIP